MESGGGQDRLPMSDQLVTLQAYNNAQEAEFARGLLEFHRIEVFLADENTARIETSMSIGGVRLRVRESDIEDARRILRDTLADNAAEVEETFSEHSCPICGGQRSESLSDPVRWVLGLALLGIPLLLWGPKRRCQICGNIWRE
jgi:hypothetical protein